MEYEDIKKEFKQEIDETLRRIYTKFVFGDYSREEFKQELSDEINRIRLYLKYI